MDPGASIMYAWKTNSRATEYLVECLPATLWAAKLPNLPTRTIRSIVAHLHNARCSWIRTLGSEHGVDVPEQVDRRAVTQRQLLKALPRSARGIGAILQLGLANDGVVPASRSYVWRNLPLDIGHVLSYFAAHEAHHRGQIVLAARQLQQRLPDRVTGGLWQWTVRSRETR